ncbi:MAG: 2-dehydropantoate 2-reductase [Candidatus Hydrogenedentota bacterium]
MKVSVIGPGAMGCLFAARLAKGNAQTTLVDYKAERASRLNESGIRVESDAHSMSAKPAVSTSIPPDQDLIIVFVKSHATRSLNIPQNVPVLTLQNGLGNTEALCTAVGSAHVLAGVTHEAAILTSEGQVTHTASANTTFGSWTSCPTLPAEEALTAAGFQFEVTTAPGQTLWEKVSASNAINPLTALLDVQNGALLEIAEVRQLMRDLVVESVKVASTEGYRFPYSLVEETEELCRKFPHSVSPMLQDIRAGKPTEIESLSGEVLRRAQVAALPVPRTRVIYQLLRGMESR